jgi:predicted O-methyltransferase YrrM
VLVEKVIARCFRHDKVIARSDGSVHELFPVGIPQAEGESLRRWVESEGATSTLEVGLGYGISTLFVCAGLLANGSGSRHVAVDPFQETRFAGVGRQLMDEAGVADLVELYMDESQLALPRLLAGGSSFDLAFVDGNHRFDGVFVDLVYLGRLVRPGGIVFVDDLQLPSVGRAVSFCVTNLEWQVEEDDRAEDQHHWVVLRTPTDPPRRSFDHYVEF